MEPNSTVNNDEIQPLKDKPSAEQPKQDTNATAAAAGGGGGWGWGFSPLSVLSDLQKAAEEISRNAAEVAKTAANSISDLQKDFEDSESSKESHPEASDKDQESEDEDDKKRKAALERLEKASEDTFLGQGIKAIDTSVESFATGAWQALGNAWKGGSSFVQKLEDSIQQGGLPAAGSVLETGRAITAKGIEVLEYVGKETVDLLITESGMEVDKNAGEGGNGTEVDQLMEEVTFDRCFYIYGGPEQLEELEALSNHYALLFNRRKAKLSTEDKAAYDVKLKEVQQMLILDNKVEAEKGKNVPDSTHDEIKSFHSSSVSKAAEMAAGFANALAGLSPSDIVQRTGGRLDSLHSEGIHRLSEMCCIAVSQLLNLGKSVIHNANKAQDAAAAAADDEDILNIDWPEDSIEKAKTMRMKTQSMTGYLEAVAISFVTGISDVAEAYAAAIKSATADSPEVVPEKSIQDKVNSFSEDLHVNRTTAVGKIQDGLHFLAYVILTTSMPAV
ncbi:hypothetical protein HanRHA438_Chr10g0460791 [Helianthus annuus]|uniref:DUF7798 domain-containing protein n=1 Tax=Helianthus annuus TaxID=4232 RepID=A0A251TL59_HELAN|nr:uncharacterized protein LOC110885770 [Helianthus annuus]KAF5787031.1 hypothetical protein HanXRQr2_Chr10g0448261 [Helianthus annuus]KAJ0514340.1 hypothetical protein HanHA300_Chr10g0368511 [Helianthus annuus]KAJ0880227.1 hypothetical protein HanRHA438_Chr10g0460791 [Helianthus annuus]